MPHSEPKFGMAVHWYNKNITFGILTITFGTYRLGYTLQVLTRPDWPNPKHKVNGWSLYSPQWRSAVVPSRRTIDPIDDDEEGESAKSNAPQTKKVKLSMFSYWIEIWQIFSIWHNGKIIIAKSTNVVKLDWALKHGTASFWCFYDVIISMTASVWNSSICSFCHFTYKYETIYSI